MKKTMKFLLSLNDFKEKENNVIQIVDSDYTFETYFIGLGQISQNYKCIQEANIVILLLDYEEISKFQNSDWEQLLKKFLTKSQNCFLIGNNPNNITINDFISQIKNLMQSLNIQKFFERKAEEFLEGQQIDDLTISPDFYNFLAYQIKNIANIQSIPREYIEISDIKFKYNIYNKTGTAKIFYKKDTAYENEIMIPNTVSYDSKDYIVTEIGDNAFEGAEIKSLSFEPGSQVKRIGKMAFAKSSISTLAIPDSLEEFDEEWCNSNENIDEIVISTKHPRFKYNKGILTNKDCDEIIFARRNLQVVDTANIKRICCSAFSSCQQITNFNINSVESIDSHAFSNCRNLKNFNILEAKNLNLGNLCFENASALENIYINICNKIVIGESCFQNCNSIKRLSLRSEEIIINKKALYGCQNLETLEINKNYNKAGSLEINDTCFNELNNLKTIDLTVKRCSICNDLFEHCKSVQSFSLRADDAINSDILQFFNESLKIVDLSSSLKMTINRSEFKKLKNLESITLKSKEIVFGECCFFENPNLESVIIENKKATGFSSQIFKTCKKLKSFKYKQNEKINLQNEFFNNFNDLQEIEFEANEIICDKNCFNKLAILNKVNFQCSTLSLNDNCFNECPAINSIILKGSVIELHKKFINKLPNLENVEIVAEKIKLDDSCFEKFMNLKNVSLEGIKISIGIGCFKDCPSIKSFRIFKSLKVGYTDEIEISDDCFNNLKELKKVEIAARFIKLGKRCFNGSNNLQDVQLCGQEITIGDSCFNNCSINSFKIVKNREIGCTNEILISDDCFNNMDKLNEVEITARDIKLGRRCFNGSKNLRSVQLCGLNITIDDICFENCSGIKSFKIIESNDIGHAERITLNKKLFSNIKNVEEIEISAGTIIIKEECFKEFHNLRNITLHGKNITINNKCFEKCSSIKSFKIVGSDKIGHVESITLKNKLFLNNVNLEEIDITANTINIGRNCFSGLKKLSNITLYGKNISIDDNCFENCSSIKSFQVAGSRNIGYPEKIQLADECFKGAVNLQEVIFKSESINIGKSCFAGLIKLKYVILYTKDAVIGSNCFNGCTSLETFTVEEFDDNIIYKIDISEQCFLNSGLKKFDVNAKKVSIGYNCFTKSKNLKLVDIFCFEVSISDYSFHNCKSLETFRIKSRKIEIKKRQFKDCTKMKNIVIGLPETSKAKNCLNLNEYCFKDATNLENIAFIGGNITISDDMLSYSSLSVLSITSASSVKICRNMFNNCKKLSKVDINSASLKIENNCFNNNPELQKVNFNCSSIDFEDNCFNDIENCDELKFEKVDYLTFFSNDFCRWNDLTNIKLMSSTYIDIGEKCFCELERLEKVSFHSKEVTIKSKSFNNCPELNSVSSLNINSSKVNSSPIFFTKQSRTNHLIEKFIMHNEVFNSCYNLSTLSIDATKKILIGERCFYKIVNLETISLKCPDLVHVGISSFRECKGKSSIPQACYERIEKIDESAINDLKFKNQNKFISFYVLGYEKGAEEPSFISAFPSDLRLFDNSELSIMRNFCYPNGKVSIPQNLPNDSNIINGFVFNFVAVAAQMNYIGICFHFYITESANSFVGNKYDRSCPFCICLLTDNPEISSHFSFLQSIVGQIVDETNIAKPRQDEIETIIQSLQQHNLNKIKKESNDNNNNNSNDNNNNLNDNNNNNLNDNNNNNLNDNNNNNLNDNNNNNSNGINRKINMVNDPNCKLISLSSFASSMSFLLPKLVEYYTSDNTIGPHHYKYLLYPTLQTLLSSLSLEQIVNLVMLMICERKIVIRSADLSKVSFCALALKNLTNDVDVLLLFHPVMPLDMFESRAPYLFGNVNIEKDIQKQLTNSQTNELEAVIVNLDTQEIIYDDESLDILSGSQYKLELIEKAETLCDAYLNDLRIPDENDEQPESTNEIIYPNCFKYFVKTKYILNDEFIDGFSRIFTEKMMRTYRENMSIDTTDESKPFYFLNKSRLLYNTKLADKKFVVASMGTQTFENIHIILQKEANSEENLKKIKIHDQDDTSILRSNTYSHKDVKAIDLPSKQSSNLI